MVNALYSPDGRLIAGATSEREVVLFDSQPLWFRKMLTKESDKKPISRSYAEMIGSQFRPLPLSFSPDGKVLVAAGIAGNIVAWDVESASEKYRISTSGSVDDVAFLPNGQSFATAGSVVAIRRTNDGATDYEIAIQDGAKASSIAISPDGQLIIVGLSTGEITVINISNRSVLKTLKRHAAPVTGLAFRPDGSVFASTAGGYDLQFWKRDSAGSFEMADPPFTAASVAQDSVGFAQGAGALLWLLGTVSGARIVGAPTMGAPPFMAGADTQFNRVARKTPFHCGPRVAFSANGRFLASTANLLECTDCIGRLAPAFMLFVTDLETGKTATARDRGCAVSLSPDGKIVTAGGVGAPALLDSATGDTLPSPKR
jgi:WD40 repeat protein